MKHLKTDFEDFEYIALKKIKGKRTWHDFILLLLNWEDEPVVKGGN